VSWRWLDRKKQEAGVWSGFLEQGVKLEGTLEARGTLRIDSEMNGTIISDDTLILGEHSVIEGQVIGRNVLVEGRFRGTIQAKSRVEIRANAIVSGEIETPCLMIGPGSVFEGQCRMVAPTEAGKPLTIAIRPALAAAATPN
jgi:cytoskeletal protein CcmA (bactofilin family)